MKVRKISYDVYLDKVMGGWIGKSLGGIVGAPFEAHKIQGDMTQDNCWPSKIYPNDDLDIQVVWLEMMEECGPYFTRNDLVRFWQDRCWYNFAEYGFFLYNVQRGINPPLSGRFNNMFYRESMGCPIRAEIWGLVSPGNPELAAAYAKWDGELDHIDNSVWAEQFWAAAAAEGFFANDLEEALAAGKRVVPEDSDISQIFCEVTSLWKELGDWRRIWRRLVRKLGHRDGSKVQINFAFTLLSLYAGEGDFKKTIVTAINCGWDTDCTAATAGALLGVLQGASRLPDDWKSKMGDRLTCDVAVRHKTALLTEFSVDTCIVGLEVALTRNPIVRIVDVPEDVLNEAVRRKNSRSELPLLTIESFYPEGPVLYKDKVTQVVLRLGWRGQSMRKGKLTVTAPPGVNVSPTETLLCLQPDSVQEVMVSVCRDKDSDVIWDKNLLQAVWVSEEGESVSHTFGLAGSRQWLVYGPYWDAWDTTRWEICPYRNDELISHPVHVPGCHPLLVHQYVRLDREYLNETLLLEQDICDEEPFTVERGEDHIDSGHLGGFTGEACYYLVRDIVANEPVECNVSIGATGPFVIWMDGKEVFRNERISSWFFQDYVFRAEFDRTPKRMVIKCIRPTDEFRFSLCFMKTDVPGDKTVGVSYLLDCMGNKVKDLG